MTVATPDLLKTLTDKLAIRDTLSDHEKRLLNDAVETVRTVPADQDIVREGELLTISTVLIEGIAARYKVLDNGQRQITSFHVPGDFVDLPAFLLHQLDHNILAVCDCRIAVVPHAGLRRITETQPHLARMLWLTSMIDAAIHREWIVRMGRMPAVGHLAHLVCEFYLRLREIGLVENFAMQLPITQDEFGDALGLSAVHVNRCIQDLRRRGVLSWQGKAVTILDWDRLVEIGEFDAAYLHMLHDPR